MPLQAEGEPAPGQATCMRMGPLKRLLPQPGRLVNMVV